VTPNTYVTVVGVPGGYAPALMRWSPQEDTYAVAEVKDKERTAVGAALRAEGLAAHLGLEFRVPTSLAVRS
jgi:hypothetical protein